MRLSLYTPGQRRQLGEILVEQGVLTDEELKSALSEQRRTRSKLRLGTLLMEQGLLSQQQFMVALSQQMTVVRRFGELLEPIAQTA